MSLTLYHSPYSTCSQKVRLALAEKGLDFDHKVIDFNALDHLTDDYLAINPNGVVPTLVDDGRPVVDSSVICEYLDEVFPEPAIAPRDAYGRAQMRAWMRYMEEVPTVAIRVPSFNDIFLDRIMARAPDGFAEMTARMPLRKHFYREMGPQGFAQERYDESIEKLRKSLERVEQALSDGRNYLLGERYTIADIVFVPTIVRLEDLGLARIWSELPHVADWYARLQERPSFATAYYEGSRIDAAQIKPANPRANELAPI